MEQQKTPRLEPCFTSRQSKIQAILTILYLVVHITLLPSLIMLLEELRGITFSDAQFNFIYYAVALVLMLTVNFRFLRRDFDGICDRPFYSLYIIIGCYLGINVLNMFASTLLVALLGGDGNLSNQNNAAVIEAFQSDSGLTKAMTVFMAPIVEELLFRAGIFSNIRNAGHRIPAYIISTLAFAIMHVWQFAVIDWKYLAFLLMYIPSGIMLCICYERTNSIFSPILLHMTVNSVSLAALSTLI